MTTTEEQSAARRCENLAARGLLHEHITLDGQFKSDKYPECPAGKVPLSTSDPMAQALLWEYARRRRAVDSQFSDDLQACLLHDGFKPGWWRMLNR